MKPRPKALLSCLVLVASAGLSWSCRLTHADEIANAAPASASVSPVARGFTLVLAGSPTSNEIHISHSADGRSYIIESSAALEVGSDVCANPPGNPNELIRQVPATVGKSVLAPATFRGGPGNDTLVGGPGDGRLIAGLGDDKVVGRCGEDWL